MAIRARIDVIDRNILFRPGLGLSDKDISAAFAKFAAGQIAIADQQNAEAAGVPIPHIDYVDGRQTNDLASVKPNGTIIAEWSLGTDVVRWVYDKIMESSPVRTGRFRDSQRIYADGIEVDTPEEAVGAQEIVIASVVPYARKIEGIGRKAPLSPKAPHGVYQAVATLAKARFGNIAVIKFATREIVGGGTALSAWATAHSAKIGHERKRAKQHAKDSRQPAVIITLR